jgi:D-galactarolactone isomerase
MTISSSPWPGACDSHMHVYEDAYPLAATATFKPPHAPASAYRTVQRELNLARTVAIQPTGYGFDNRCTLAGVTAIGAEARAVVVAPAEATPAQLETLHEQGARGVRYMMLPGGVLPWSGLERSAAAIAPLGWHIDLQLDGRDLPLHEAMLARLPCRLVIDHVARFMGPVEPDSEPIRVLCRLLDSGRCWIKISAPYESSRRGPPGYDDIAWIARLLAQRYPERCLWASNWPHPNQNPAPSNAAMFAWGLAAFADSMGQRKALVDNPAELYGLEGLDAT